MPGEESIEDRVGRLVIEFATNVHPRPLDARLSLSQDLAIESLSLVSLVLRLGDELGVDVVEQGLNLGPLKTVGDLVEIAHKLSNLKAFKEPTIGQEHGS